MFRNDRNGRAGSDRASLYDDITSKIIAELEVLAEKMLKQFFRATGGVKPARIVFYRDGVSEGQFAQVTS